LKEADMSIGIPRITQLSPWVPCISVCRWQSPLMMDETTLNISDGVRTLVCR